ncbi:MAG: hypothetical protein OK439_05915, partial [Thaumarchaeota archaeon]|nr:hypothetical protein [Nitrososphaerota archaeon]
RISFQKEQKSSQMSDSNNDSEKQSDRTRNNQKLSLKDKIWIGAAIAIFVIAFVIILVFGVF